MLAPIDREFSCEFRRRAQERFPGYVREVRVFGSRAQGRARPDSDLDLFILVAGENRDTQRELQDLAFELSRELELPYFPSAHVVSQARWRRSLELESLFAQDILARGVWYDRR